MYIIAWSPLMLIIIDGLMCDKQRIYFKVVKPHPPLGPLKTANLSTSFMFSLLILFHHCKTKNKKSQFIESETAKCYSCGSSITEGKLHRMGKGCQRIFFHKLNKLWKFAQRSPDYETFPAGSFNPFQLTNLKRLKKSAFLFSLENHSQLLNWQTTLCGAHLSLPPPPLLLTEGGDVFGEEGVD